MRYRLHTPDGVKMLDRCGRHDSKIRSLVESRGEWRPFHRKNTFKVWDIEDVLKQRNTPG